MFKTSISEIDSCKVYPNYNKLYKNKSLLTPVLSRRTKTYPCIFIKNQT